MWHFAWSLVVLMPYPTEPQGSHPPEDPFPPPPTHPPTHPQHHQSPHAPTGTNNSNNSMYSAGGGKRAEAADDAYHPSYAHQQPITAYPSADVYSSGYEVPAGHAAGAYQQQPAYAHSQPSAYAASQAAFAHAAAPHAHHHGAKPPAVYQQGGDDDYYDPEAAQQAVPSSFVEKAEGQMRLALLRKVYSILTMQLLLTIAVACLFSFHDGVNRFVMSTPQLFPVALVLSFACLIALFCFRQKHPWNMVILGVFTLVQSYTLGLVCSLYYRQGAGELVLQAFGITAGIFLGLTAYTLTSKKDFSFLGGFCFAGLIGLMVWGLISWLTGWRSTFWYSTCCWWLPTSPHPSGSASKRLPAMPPVGGSSRT